MWKTLILKRVQDVYTKVTKVRPTHYVRFDDMITVPAPLGDLLYSMGSYYNREEGILYTPTQPAQPATPEDWWTVDSTIVRQWNTTMKRFTPFYTMRQTPLKSDYDLKPLILATISDSGVLRSVRAKYSFLEMTDGLIALTHDSLYHTVIHSFDECNILVVESKCRNFISKAYVGSYKI